MRTRRILGGELTLLLLGAASLAAATQPARADQGPQTNQQSVSSAADMDLARAITKDLRDAEYADLDDVRVEVHDGVVTLTGKVDSDYARDEAMQLAHAYEGVDLVVDRLAMPPRTVRTDEQIETDVERVLQQYSTFDLDRVDVEAHDGAVTLSGLTDTYRNKCLAKDLTESVTGVSHVDNHIEVLQPYGAPARSDQQIRQEIQESMIRLFGPEAADVDVDVQGGRVELEGDVPTSEVRDDVIDMAWVAGVMEIDDNDLKIDLNEDGEAEAAAAAAAGAGGAASDVQHAAYRTGGDVDADLQRTISEEFDEEPVLDRMEPAVRVDNGVVYLTGDVESESARRRAEEIARGTEGVVLVDNKLTVRGASVEEYLSDEAIQHRVEADLYNNPFFERNQMRVSVDDGVVRLTGRVWSSRERAAAEDIARGVTGVKDVRNDLTVSN